jgi:hypothetical protein
MWKLTLAAGWTMELEAIGPRREFEWFFKKRLNQIETMGFPSRI